MLEASLGKGRCPYLTGTTGARLREMGVLAREENKPLTYYDVLAMINNWFFVVVAVQPVDGERVSVAQCGKGCSPIGRADLPDLQL